MTRLKTNWLIAFAVLLLTITSACAAPPPAESDAQSFAARHLGGGVAVTVLRHGAGEGDSDNRYDHVRLRLLSAQALRVDGGAFAGLKLDPGVPKDVELELLYQWSDDRWRNTWTGVNLSPR